ncbi:MAG: ABC transporter substrate-binding protein [Rhodoglobus sp.]
MSHHLARKLPLLAATAATLALLAGCSTGSPAPTVTTLTIGAREDLLTWDPTVTVEGHQAQYMQAVYDTLLKNDATGTPQPNVATSWEYSSDQKTLTLNIRDDVTFADGEVLTAAGVEANLEAMQKGTGNGAGYLTAVQSIDAASDTTVVITLAEPDPALLYNLGREAGTLTAPDEIGSEGLATTPAGSGPYTLDLKKTVRGSKYVFTERADYWGDLKAYPFGTIVITPLVDDTARFNAIAAGQVDVISGSPTMVAQAKKQDLNVILNPGDRIGIVLADRDGSVLSPLGDVRVRQAINYAIDRSGIVDQLALSFGTPTNQIFAKSSQAWTADLEDTYPYDPAKAKELLAEAGYPDGFDLPFVTSDYFSTYEATFKQLLDDVGIRVQYTKVPAANLLAELYSGKYSSFFYPLSTSPNAWKDILFNVAPAGAVNLFHSTNPEIAGLLGDVQKTTGDDQTAAYQALNKYLVDNAWFDPWYIQDDVYLSSKTVTVTPTQGNIVPDLTGITPAQ